MLPKAGREPDAGTPGAAGAALEPNAPVAFEPAVANIDARKGFATPAEPVA